MRLTKSSQIKIRRERNKGTIGLKTTAIATNPAAQMYLLVRSACVATRKPDTQTTTCRKTCKGSLGKSPAARSNIATEAHFATLVSIEQPHFFVHLDFVDQESLACPPNQNEKHPALQVATLGCYLVKGRSCCLRSGTEIT